MWLDRRRLLGSLATVLLAPDRARAAIVADSAGRSVPIPARVERVFAAGPPAAILLYMLAPDFLLGWPRANRPQECAYMLPDICTRPEVGRITGRGSENTFAISGNSGHSAHDFPPVPLFQGFSYTPFRGNPDGHGKVPVRPYRPNKVDQGTRRYTNASTRLTVTFRAGLHWGPFGSSGDPNAIRSTRPG